MTRAGFASCLALGHALRAAKYARARVVRQDGKCHVHKRRAFYAPLLIRLSVPLLRLLDAGVRVLPQRAWEEQERRMYRTLYGMTIEIVGRTLVLPCLPGRTLATLLDDPSTEKPVRRMAIERTIAALSDLHRRGITHGDAMAENVLIDLETGTARWFDFETVHESARPGAWRRADDLRALLATCVIRTAPEERAEIQRLIVAAYGDAAVAGLVAASFASVRRRALPFHLGQAALPLETFRQVAQTLGQPVR